MASKKQIILPIVALGIGIGGFSALSAMKKPPEAKEAKVAVPLVKVEQVNMSTLSLNVDSHGIVLPKYETNLVAQVSGQIVSLSDKFVRGGFVAEGEVLARIDPSDYEAALIEAKASLASSRAALQQERAKGHVAESEWKRITDTAPTELSLRKPQLAQELARVKAAEATVKRAERNMERTYIRAPYQALIEQRQVGLGSVVNSGTALGKLLNVDVAEIRLPVADNQLKYLTNQGIDSSAVIRGEFSGEMRHWAATIVRSEGVVDNQSRMTYLVAEVVDPYGLESDKQPLRFGSYVNAEINGVSLASAASLPRHLVDENRVAVLDNENKLRFNRVTIARQNGDQVVISSGLNDGDRYIVSALDYPVEGMALALPGMESDDAADVGQAQLALKGE